ncbi:hypothetical protein [Sphingomonas sp. MMS24-J13]|uniref:hypothetical protein n=1 Tax=Sphingomonas sp. MMS24-J13 TaxID=3238686 RepID=UPI00384EB99C
MNAPISQDRCDRLRRLAATHNLTIAAQIVGISMTAASGIKRRGWRMADGVAARRRPRPHDFVIQASRMTLAELQRHYQTGQHQVARWLVGIERTYQPKTSAVVRKERPTRAEMAARISELGATEAAKSFGVTQRTFIAWRTAAGLPVQRKRKTIIRERAARTPRIGWAERYVAEARG